MRKEYSDLSDRQKMIYIKQNIVTFTCMFIPMLIIAACLLSVAALAQSISHTMPSTNSTSTVEEKNSIDMFKDLWVMISAIFFLAVVFGLMSLGVRLGEWLCDKLNLYTDLNLEGAERRVAEIKKVLASEASIRPQGGS